MTFRTYGKWPGWCVEAGWCEDKGHWFLIISKFDGNWETEIPADHCQNPFEIQSYLLELSEKWPEMYPPPGFIEDLINDEGCVGFHVKEVYGPVV